MDGGTGWIGRGEALARLGVKTQTLYAYVSRGRITALALVDRGVLVFEGYGSSKGASPQGRFASYSVAKSVTALAVGEALCAGKIKAPSTKENTRVRMMTFAMSPKVSPSRPSMKKKEQKATTVVSTADTTEGSTSKVPSMAARMRDAPRS